MNDLNRLAKAWADEIRSAAAQYAGLCKMQTKADWDRRRSRFAADISASLQSSVERYLLELFEDIDDTMSGLRTHTVEEEIQCSESAMSAKRDLDF